MKIVLEVKMKRVLILISCLFSVILFAENTNIDSLEIEVAPEDSMRTFTRTITKANSILEEISVYDKFITIIENYIQEKSYLDFSEIKTLHEIDILEKSVGLMFAGVIKARRMEIIEAIKLDNNLYQKEDIKYKDTQYRYSGDTERERQEILSIKEYFDNQEKKRIPRLFRSDKKIGAYFSFSKISLDYPNDDKTKEFYNVNTKVKSHIHFEAGLIAVDLSELFESYKLYATSSIAANAINARSRTLKLYPSLNFEIGLSQFYKFKSYPDLEIEIPINLCFGIELSENKPLYYIKSNLLIWHIGFFNSSPTKVSYGWYFPKIIRWLRDFTF